MSEKNDNDEESRLRPVESPGESDGHPASAGWMDALGVDKAPEAAPREAEQEPAAGSAEPDAGPEWMDQLGGDETQPTSGARDSEWVEPADDGTRPASKRRRERTLAVALVAAFVVLAAGVGLLIIAQMSGESEPTDLAADLDRIEAESGTSQASAEPTPAAADELECETSESDEKVTGDGAGDTDSVAGVVLAFEHAYYIERDAEEIEPLLAEDSTLTDLDALQEGIDSVPTGTEHCVSITPDGETAEVQITEARPSQAPETFVQEITTSRDGDRVEIVDITAKEDQ